MALQEVLWEHFNFLADLFSSEDFLTTKEVQIQILPRKARAMLQ